MSHRVGSLVALTAVLAIAVLAAPGHAHAGALTPHEEKLVAAAKKEGAVTLINPPSAGSRRARSLTLNSSNCTSPSSRR
jgi:hypothetical protein